MPFNTKLKNLRLQVKLTQEQFAEKIGITRRIYVDYETGEKYPPVERLIVIANFFNVSISFLLDEQNEYTINQIVEETKFLLGKSKLSDSDKETVVKTIQEL